MPDKFGKEVRSRIMASIRFRNTKPELVLKSALRGFHFQYQPKLYGKPDFVSKSGRIVIFVDGDFWHGYNWKKLGKIPPRKYWQKKIWKNIVRDKKYNLMLKKKGWIVLRFWEWQVTQDVGSCVKTIKTHLQKSR